MPIAHLFMFILLDVRASMERMLIALAIDIGFHPPRQLNQRAQAV